MRHHLTVLLCLLAGAIASTEAVAEHRVALVVGNSHYVNTVELRNPTNDAEDVAAKLKLLGFSVMLGLDLDQRDFARKVEEFGRVLDGADVGLFFYAGHGVQVNDRNYLVSTGAKLESEFLVSAEAIEVDGIVRMMEARSATNIVFLDACRNNPLAENLRRSAAGSRSLAVGAGLAKITPSNRDTLVAFSAAPGQTASDGAGRNSPFTTALLKHIGDPNTEVSVMLKEVAGDVRDATQNGQRPQQVSDMARTFFFANAAPVAAAPVPAAAPEVATAPFAGTDRSVEVAFFQSASAANDCQAMRSYLNRFPNGTFTDLAKLSEQRLCNPQAAAPPGRAPEVIAALPPAAAPPAPRPSPSELARTLQAELIRVGCGGSELTASGDWDTTSKTALGLFNRYGKTKLGGPSQDAIAAVHGHDERVCPLECGPGTQARGNTCVALPAKPEAEPAPKEASRPKPAPPQHANDPSPPPAARPPHAAAAAPHPAAPAAPGTWSQGGMKCHMSDSSMIRQAVVCD